MYSFQLFIYNIGLRLYYTALRWLLSLTPRQSCGWGEERIGKNGSEKLNAYKGKRIWFHCASLGEFEQARPVLEKFGGDHREDAIIVTFFSPSGYEVRKNYPSADFITYLPLDTPQNAKDFSIL